MAIKHRETNPPTRYYYEQIAIRTGKTISTIDPHLRRLTANGCLLRIDDTTLGHRPLAPTSNL